MYLIFSITKSGEFFGLAKMASPSGRSEWIELSASGGKAVSDSTGSSSKEGSPPPAYSDSPSLANPSEEHESQSATPSTPPNRSPYGSPPPTSRVANVRRDSIPSDYGLTNDSDNPGSWGKPFAVQWLSLKKIPFPFTSHIRNAWNDNHEVKVSRDCTEVQPDAGALLHALFFADGQSSPGDAATGSTASPATSPISPPLGVRSVTFPALSRNNFAPPRHYSQAGDVALAGGYPADQYYYMQLGGYQGFPASSYPYKAQQQQQQQVQYVPYNTVSLAKGGQQYAQYPPQYQPYYHQNGLYMVMFVCLLVLLLLFLCLDDYSLQPQMVYQYPTAGWVPPGNVPVHPGVVFQPYHQYAMPASPEHGGEEGLAEENPEALAEPFDSMSLWEQK